MRNWSPKSRLSYDICELTDTICKKGLSYVIYDLADIISEIIAI